MATSTATASRSTGPARRRLREHGLEGRGRRGGLPDGSQVKSPKALCELQGYVFDAWMRMAEVFEALGEGERAATLRRKAAELQARFEARFWCEDIGFYAFGLDPDKQPIKTIASNAGHLSLERDG